MKHRDREFFLPILLKHLDAVAAHMERSAAKHGKTDCMKAPRRRVLEVYIETRSLSESARRLGVSRNLIDRLMWAAICRAKRLEGIAPGGMGPWDPRRRS